MLLANVPAAASEPAPTVVLVRPPGPGRLLGEALVRARAELEAAGFRVLEVDAGSFASPREALDEAAASRSAVAAIALFAAKGGAEADVWIVDRLTRKTSIRSVRVGALAPDGAPSALAIRTVELLRASLQEGSIPAPDATSPAALPEDVAQWVGAPPRAAPRAPLEGLGVQAGVGVIGSFDAVPLAAAPVLRVSYGGASGLAARATVAWPSTEATIESASGTADVTQSLVAAEVAYARGFDDLPLVVIGALGVGGYHLEATGHPAAPARGVTDGAWSVVFVAGAGLGLRLTDRFFLLADASAVLVEPRPVVTLGDARLGSAGRPSLLGGLGLAATF